MSFQTAQQAATAVRLSYASRILYQFVLGSTKLGICACYMRIFIDRRSRTLIYLLLGFIFLFSMPLTIYVMAACVPIDGGWQGEPVSCHSSRAPDLFVSAACNIVADILLLIFIVPRVSGCRDPWCKKTWLLLIRESSVAEHCSRAKSCSISRLISGLPRHRCGCRPPFESHAVRRQLRSYM